MARNVSVRLITATVDRHLTDREVQAFTYKSGVPGGYLDASLTGRVGIADFPDLTRNSRLIAYSRQTGKVLYEGRTDQPVWVKGSGGEEFTVTALGAAAQMRDRTEKLIYIYSTRDGIKQEDLLAQVPGAQVETTGTIPTGTDAGSSAVVVQFPSGTALVTDAEAGVRDYSFRDSLMLPGALTMKVVGGSTQGNWYLYGDVSGGTPVTITSQGNSTTPWNAAWHADPTIAGAPAVDEWPYDTGTLGLSYRWTAGASTIANDTAWVAFYNLVMQAQLLDESGAHIHATSLPSNTYVLASQIVADLIGRLLTFVDPALTSIEATTYQIDQAAWPDGITAAGVLEWLTTFEPDFFHEVLESDPTTGKHRFNLRQWDDGTNPRYAIVAADGFKRDGGENDRCNCVYVYYTDAQDITRRVAVGQDIPELGGNPVVGGVIDPTLVDRVMQAETITLPKGISSEANAVQIATALLEQSNRGANAGTATRRTEIIDLWSRVKVQPGEMLPGYTVLLSDTWESHRLTGVAVDGITGEATLTLNDPVRTLEQFVAAAVGKRGDQPARQTR
jgi:hypothetical protein